MSKCKCSHGIRKGECVRVFQEWVTDTFDVENALLWRVRRKSDFTEEHTRIWPNRPYFEIGNMVISKCADGGVYEVYEILHRSGTPNRPRYDIRVIASCCPSNIYTGDNRRIYRTTKVGTIEKNIKGYFLLKVTPKQEPMGKLFHCDDTHVDKTDWPTYTAPEPSKKKRRRKK